VAAIHGGRHVKPAADLALREAVAELSDVVHYVGVDSASTTNPQPFQYPGEQRADEGRTGPRPVSYRGSEVCTTCRWASSAPTRDVISAAELPSPVLRTAASVAPLGTTYGGSVPSDAAVGGSPRRCSCPRIALVVDLSN